MAMRFIAVHYNRKIAGAARGLGSRGLGSGVHAARPCDTARRARYTGGAALRRRRSAIHFHAEAT